MAKFRSLQNTFLGGELSPHALGRTDLPIYRHACHTLKNVFPYQAGGVYRRPGTLYNHASYAEALFFPFTRSQNTPSSLLELLTNGATGGTTPTSDITPAAPVGYAAPSPAVVIPTKAENFQSQFAQSADILRIVNPTMKPKVIQNNKAALDFPCNDFDVYYTSGRAWPFQKINTDVLFTLESSGTTGTVTITAKYNNVATGFFDTTMIGSTYQISHLVATTMYTGYFKVTAVTQPDPAVLVSTCTATALNIQSTNQTRLWAPPAWSDYYGWPTTVGYWQDRLFYAGQAGGKIDAPFPDRAWFSRTGEYTIMSAPQIGSVALSGVYTDFNYDPISYPVGDDPFTIVLYSQQLNCVSWAAAEGGSLLVGTSGDEFRITFVPTATVPGFARETYQLTATSHHGSAPIMPARGNGEMFIVNKSRDTIMALVYSDELQSYDVQNLQSLYEHRPEAQIDPSTLQANRSYQKIMWDSGRAILWCLDTAGNFWGFHRDRKNGINQAISQDFGGEVQDFALVHNSRSGLEDIWLKIKRTINSSTVYYAERICGKDVPTESAFDAVATPLVDCATYLFYDPTAGNDTTERDAAHLKDEELVGHSVQLAGAVTGTFTHESDGVVNTSTGKFDIKAPDPGNTDAAVRHEFWGLPYTSVIAPVRIEAGSQIGTAQGALKRIHQVIIRFIKTLSAKVGRDATNIETILFRESSTPMNESPEFFNGDKLIYLDGDYDRDAYIYLIQDEPLPFGVASIIAEGQTVD